MKIDLALNNLQWLICHKTQPNPTKPTPNNLSYEVHLFYIYQVIASVKAYPDDISQWMLISVSPQ